MTAHDSSPPDGRRRKLVLRKVADGTIVPPARPSMSSLPAMRPLAQSKSSLTPLPAMRAPLPSRSGLTPLPAMRPPSPSRSSLSSLTPLPLVRPPPRPSSPALAAAPPAGSSVVTRLTGGSGAWAVAAMTPPAPRITEISVRSAIASTTSDSVSEVPPFPSPRPSRPAWGLESAHAGQAAYGQAAYGQAANPARLAPITGSFPAARPDVLAILAAPGPSTVGPSGWPSPAAPARSTSLFSSAGSYSGAEPSPAPGDRAVRSTVAPVVATLPPPPLPFTLPPMRARFSADSKLLAGGGALALAMLALAVGVWVGRSGQTSSPATASAAAAAFPVVVEAKAMAASTALPLAPVVSAVTVATPFAPVTTAAAATPFAPVASPSRASVDLDAPATIDVQQLPLATRARARSWVPAATRPVAGAGWTIAAQPQRRAGQQAPAGQPAVTQPAAAPAPAQPDAIQGTGAVATGAETTVIAEPAPSPEPTVDPFVQAVREDIREDESRGANK